MPNPQLHLTVNLFNITVSRIKITEVSNPFIYYSMAFRLGVLLTPPRWKWTNEGKSRVLKFYKMSEGRKSTIFIL